MYKRISYFRLTKLLLVVMTFASLIPVVQAEILDKNRIEKDRADIASNSQMEVITSITIFKAGDKIPLHFHHGIETAYIIQGATLNNNKGTQLTMKTGDTLIAMRNKFHGGVTIAPHNELKLFTVHLVDKNKPLYNLK